MEDRHGGAPRLLSARAFVEMVGGLTDGPRPGNTRWIVEALDREGRVMWRAHCADVQSLRGLARELAVEAQAKG
jgi:hypothetical protein